MDYLEKITQTKFLGYVIYWYRYVDDVIVLFKGTDRQLSQFFNSLNLVNDNIKFTKELGGLQLNFLDISIRLEEGLHKFSVFRKPTYTDVVIHNSSNHPTSHKFASFYSMIHRALSVPMNSHDFQKEKSIIYAIAESNGYSKFAIDKIWRRVSDRKFQGAVSNLERLERENNDKWVSLPYYGGISQKVGNIIERRGFKVGYYSQNSLKKMLGSVKDKIPLEDRSGVYMLKCDCGIKYCGQTGRKFKDRIKEHERVYTDGVGESAFAKHLIEEGHQFNFNMGRDNQSVEIVHLCNKGPKMNALEQYEIIKIHNSGYSVNEINFQNSSPLFYVT